MRNLTFIIIVFLLGCNSSFTKIKNKDTAKEWIPFEDANSSIYFLINKNTIGSGDNPDIEKEAMPEIDVQTFEIWKETECARDKNKIYWNAYGFDVYL